MVATIAPWAEPVPGVERLVTAEELLHWPEDRQYPWRYELMAGRLMRMSPPGFEHGEVTLNLSSPLHRFVKAHGLGVVTAAETGYLLSRPHEGDTVFAPDIAFVSVARLAGQPARGTAGRRSYLRVAPDLAIEVASPDQHRPEMAAKALQYLPAGVQTVWIIWPGRREVDVWRSGSPEPVVTLKSDNQLEDPELLPGFSLRVAEIFD